MADFNNDPDEQALEAKRLAARVQREKEERSRIRDDKRDSEIRSAWFDNFFTLNVNPRFFEKRENRFNGAAAAPEPWEGHVQMYEERALRSCILEINSLRTLLKDFIAANERGRNHGVREWSEEYLTKWVSIMSRELRRGVAEAGVRLEQCMKVSNALFKHQQLPRTNSRSAIIFLGVKRNKFPKDDRYIMRFDQVEGDQSKSFCELWEIDQEIHWSNLKSED